jgi:Protein of unknown function (DUF4242)
MFLRGTLGWSARRRWGRSPRSKLTAIEQFPDITWEHSHVCAADDGRIKSFCVYAAPSPQRLQEHADSAGGIMITSIYEIVGDLTPDEVRI